MLILVLSKQAIDDFIAGVDDRNELAICHVQQAPNIGIKVVCSARPSDCDDLSRIYKDLLIIRSIKDYKTKRKRR